MLWEKPVLDNLIHQYNPDVIVGTESWLKPTISSSEIFPPDYEVFRRDRSDGYGGVFLACSKNYSWQNVPIKTSYNVEAIACKLNLKSGSLIVLGVYRSRPPNSDLSYLQSMCNVIQDIVKENPTDTIWIGDLNLPNWSTNLTSGNNYPISFCNFVLDLFCDITHWISLLLIDQHL